MRESEQLTAKKQEKKTVTWLFWDAVVASTDMVNGEEADDRERERERGIERRGERESFPSLFCRPQT